MKQMLDTYDDAEVRLEKALVRLWHNPHKTRRLKCFRNGLNSLHELIWVCNDSLYCHDDKRPRTIPCASKP